ncbi:MAG: GNAT family N-acetyltransferase [Gemmatimonadaceae bacterium]
MITLPAAHAAITDIVRGDDELLIPIRDDHKATVGWLTPITIWSLNDCVLMESISRWRNNASRSFLTHFDATPERTRQWLQNVVLRDSARLLFLIHSTTKLIGHFGFRNLTLEAAELDSLVRGESGGHPQLMHLAEVAMVQWMFSALGISSLYGYVVEGNWQALELHARVGFRHAELIPLCREVRGTETAFVMGEAGGKSPDDLYSRKITLSREHFNTQGMAA